MPEPPVEVPEAADGEAGSDEEDTFQALGRLGDEAAAREAVRKAKGEKKRKRKEAKEAAQDGEGGAQREKKKKKKKTS